MSNFNTVKYITQTFVKLGELIKIDRREMTKTKNQIFVR